MILINRLIFVISQYYHVVTDCDILRLTLRNIFQSEAQTGFRLTKTHDLLCTAGAMKTLFASLLLGLPSVVVFFTTTSVHGQTQTFDSQNQFTQARSYYRIEERKIEGGYKSPTDLMVDSFRTLASASRSHWSLLRLEKISNRPPKPTQVYNRATHFGSWLNDPYDDTCYNTRTKVLVRDSKIKVRFKSGDRCAVESGKWYDPYTARNYTEASDLQIDHMVPLKHAYMAGAWKWSGKKRCLYANDLSAKHHLVPVLAHENMSKGDSAPDGYLPPAQGSVCQYVKNWLKIKAVWQLLILPDELSAIREAVERYGCDSKQMIITDSEVRKERTRIAQNQKSCGNLADRISR